MAQFVLAMGKIRTKKSVSRSRASSAGLPTSEELKVAEETSPLLSQHILQRVRKQDTVLLTLVDQH